MSQHFQEVEIPRGNGETIKGGYLEVRRVYEELGGNDEPFVSEIVHPHACLNGEFKATVKAMPSEDTAGPDPCKVYILNDVLIIGLERKKLRKVSNSNPRLGLVDSSTVQTTFEISSSALKSRKRSLMGGLPSLTLKRGSSTSTSDMTASGRGAYRLNYLLDLRRCHIRYRTGASSLKLRYVLRLKGENRDGSPRSTTRIAILNLDFGNVDLCEAFRVELEDSIGRMDGGSSSGFRSSVGSGFSVASATSRKSSIKGGMLGPGSGRRTWSRRMTSQSMPRRKQVVGAASRPSTAATAPDSPRGLDNPRRKAALSTSSGSGVVPSSNGVSAVVTETVKSRKDAEESRASTNRLLTQLWRMSSQHRAMNQETL